ncbi:hypothetical protein ASPZODRAFT_16200 [Penicilliopsis zonata CBS 506.65]|uniref:Uncharacterized protein n=1 Tax=Penicilliopsis zonata CBS 506.65 TaxID=1073090 RepID=A0A1L9SGX6_9EURO|nr:hypothetical protein ASPZODRAFT_16200 [Penicilliopsis zonata CBS 506.65]OJJ46439.1 hypothetical protein ASPZODRAFT_16200 [Penicilliopsis zonata CBS 506.65]
MVRLAVDSESQRKDTWMENMLATALWQKLPPTELFFNESGFSSCDPLIPGYRPIVWGLFGGEDGSLLPYLTQLIFIITKNRINRIDALYAENPITHPYHRVRIVDAGDLPELYHHSSFGSQITLKIDGPGGERITELGVGYENHNNAIRHRYFNHGFPHFYRITTNRKSFIPLSHPKYLPTDSRPIHPMAIEPGTVPIGFYAVRQYEIGRVSFGVISRPMTSL